MKYTFYFIWCIIWSISWIIWIILLHIIYTLYHFKLLKNDWEYRANDNGNVEGGFGNNNYYYKTFFHYLWNIKDNSFKFRKIW